ncbi:MAG: protein-L-isoaspartate O-methyltransferase [Planctomycetota bacterium]|nr:MAG: protein-L-isoaspartate O-methyltransferase [Planctomycetota bacterium]
MTSLELIRKAAAVALVLLASAAATCRTPDDPPPEPGGNEKPTTTPSTAERPRTKERARERERMVADQIAGRSIRDKRVLDAMRHVPRHWFVPAEYAADAYDDNPLPIGWDQTISQPYIVALMTELLRLRPGEKVLEIGTGSGYQAAVLSELTDKVFTIEIVRPLAERTIETLQRRGYEYVRVRIGDGYKGWPEHAPFDAIIVTCAPEAPPPELVRQLAVGGRMCVPVGPEHGLQELLLLRKQADGTLKTESVAPVRFVPMTGGD